MTVLFQLIIGHAIADYALQSEAMSRYKNWNTPPEPPLGQKQVICWFYWLAAHSLVNGGTVYIITHSALLGFLETIAHCMIDFLKLRNTISLHQDQLLHIICKCIWAWSLMSAQ